ncbi:MULTISPECIES: argininosuccinate lyase [unclassified Lysobacter]|uniref:argininosuccinate lyase n=1 Tax=unclassified Lysobacter TaxID=2635362 RepID=UPI0006FDE646|nr:MULTISPECIES: argininosuccinate lyase [unclassified Lysobacter]KQZ56061.1 argininosuccinate lyase [Lysobacter sp. Root559]KRA73193.1 argininosuccinate lyase [Lysobacter sp. Root667]KRC32234.1 argininosuccinate lyase [Lysobacter sp. Root76]KRD67996.1 argininosuccinate lyase [Lysobacter sp. Root96]
MSDLLWQKPGVKVDARIQRFLAGEDVILDREFFLFDIQASRAHAQGLQQIGILSADELAGLSRELDALAADFSAGDFVLDERFEDGHSAIESRLIERLGDAGRKIHTGRSRNDQILVATRLWLKDRLARLLALCRESAQVALDRAQAEASLPLPGYTHLQRAMVSSAGMWWAAWAEGYIDDALRARQTLDWVDANPLGSAAGYGINLPLARDHTTQALGFGRLQVSAAYAQLSRGKFEMGAIEALSSALLDLRRLAWDLSLFTSAEFGFVALPAEYTTGSSIMPNKRNPDVIELMRASYSAAAAARTEIEQLLSLPSGYHRDLQFSKGAIFHAFGRGLAALELLPDLLRNLEWKPERLRAALDPSMYATDLAVDLARAGLPFREAYKQAADPARWAEGDPEASLAARVSPGAAADLRLDTLRQRLQALT